MKLRLLREDRILTQKELGLEINVSETSISFWECNRSVPSMRSIRKLKAFFGDDKIDRSDFWYED